MSAIPKCSLESALPFQASKWLHHALLCETFELQSLFAALGNKNIISLAGVNKENTEIISEEQFIKNYALYLDLLKNKKNFPPSQLHQWFTSGISVSLDHFRKIVVGDNENIIRISKPVLQIKPHWFDYSETDQRIRSDTFSLDNISWGLQFSYPQIFEDPHTKEIHKVLTEENFPNTRLFKILQKWMRENSQATPFVIGSYRVNAPIRISKGCLSWVNHHKGLMDKGIYVNA